MRLAVVGLLVLLFFRAQDDESKALDVFKDFVRHSKNGDYPKAADCLHPKSLVKVKKSILRGFEFGKPEEREKSIKALGFSSREEMEKADPRDLYVRHQSSWKDGIAHRWLLGRYVEEIVGTIAKHDRVYIVAHAKYAYLARPAGEEPLLYVAYKDGDAWKLADQGETDIGR